MLGVVDTRLFGGFSSRFRCVFCKEDAVGLSPCKDDERKRREMCRKDARLFSCRQPLKQSPLVVVLGPTASGKTEAAVCLAEKFHGEIIGADSMQIYRRMDIGTAKPGEKEMRGVPHHLIDFLDPGESFSVAQYVQLAKKAIAGVHERGGLPVLAGGTGLYISSLTNNISFEEHAGSSEAREKLRALLDEKGAAYLHGELQKCDPALAEKLHPNNTGRVIRALEVFGQTGIPMSEYQKRARGNPPEYDLCMIGLYYRDRQKLYGRIDVRVDIMIKQGLPREAKALFDEGFAGTARQAIGYKELESWFNGAGTLEEAAESIKRETRRYAKRQMTWFKRDKRINWIAVDECDAKQEAFQIAEEFLKGERL